MYRFGLILIYSTSGYYSCIQKNWFTALAWYRDEYWLFYSTCQYRDDIDCFTVLASTGMILTVLQYLPVQGWYWLFYSTCLVQGWYWLFYSTCLVPVLLSWLQGWYWLFYSTCLVQGWYWLFYSTCQYRDDIDCFTVLAWYRDDIDCFTVLAWYRDDIDCFTVLAWYRDGIDCFTVLAWYQYFYPGCRDGIGCLFKTDSSWIPGNASLPTGVN